MEITIDSGYLTYNKVGHGMPMLFIHGYPLSRKMWDPQVENLIDQASIVTMDLRGHGDSFAFEAPYTMDQLAEDCKRVIDKLNITDRMVVCGLSMGGYITFALYRIYPDLFKAMVLTSTRSGPDSEEGKANRDASIKNAMQHGASYIADAMLPKMFSPITYETNHDLVERVRGIMANTSVNGIIGSLEGMKNRPDSTPLLSKIKCPVLIIHGTDDQLIPIKDAELMEQNIPNSQLVRIARAGHLPNLEQVDNYNRAVRDFILSLT